MILSANRFYRSNWRSKHWSGYSRRRRARRVQPRWRIHNKGAAGMNSENTNAPGDPPVDLVWLNECTDGDAEAMKAMMDLYLNRTAAQLAELDAAIAAD